MILIDVNVWIALLTDAHPFQPSATQWIDSIDISERLAFCRVSQLSFLRLLTTPRVMRTEVVTQRQAWRLYRDLIADPRIVFLEEPPSLLPVFASLSDRDEISPKRWNDDYLLAFANAADISFATFDRNAAARANRPILLA